MIKIYVVKTTVEIIEGIKIVLDEEGTQPSQFQDRAMYNDSVYWKKKNWNECCDNAPSVAQYAQNFKP